MTAFRKYWIMPDGLDTALEKLNVKDEVKEPDRPNK